MNRQLSPTKKVFLLLGIALFLFAQIPWAQIPVTITSPGGSGGTGNATAILGTTIDTTSCNVPSDQNSLIYVLADLKWECITPAGAGTVTHTGTLTSGQIIKGNGSADITVGNLSGDVTTAGSLATTVVKINGVLLGTTTATSTNILVGDGSAWQSVSVSGDFVITASGVGTVNKIKNVGLGTVTATAGNLLIGDGTSWQTVATSGDVTINSTGVLTIGATKVTNAMLGGSIATSKLATLSGNGGTVATTTGSLTSGRCVKLDANANFVQDASTCYDFAQLTTNTNTTGTFTIGSGATITFSGTGIVNASKINGVPLGTVTATSGRLLVADGTNWVSVAMSGDATITSSGVITIGNGVISNAKLANSAITIGGTSTSLGGTYTIQRQIGITIDGGGSAITTGTAGFTSKIPFACTITDASIIADQSGSITIDVWKAANAVPSSGNKISASAPITLSSAQYSGTMTLTGWTTSVSANDVIGFSIATASTVTRVTAIIYCGQ